MACVPADVRLLGVAAGDLLDPPYTDSFLQLMIDNAGGIVYAACDETRGDKMVCALAAHLASLLLKGGSGSVGAVTSERAGGLARSYGNVMVSNTMDSLLATTPYGALFMMLRDSSGCGVVPLVLTD